MEEFCDCGQVHKINTKKIVVEKDALDQLIERINGASESLAILFSAEQFRLVEKIKARLRRPVNMVMLSELIPSTLNAQSLKDYGQELVVAIGDEGVISLAKYYCYCLSAELIIFPVGDFEDFTFSKFARLYDGINFCFYLAKEPSEIYVSTGVNLFNPLQSYYICSKFLAGFDNQIKKLIFNEVLCPAAENFLGHALSSFVKGVCVNDDEKNKKNIWLLIRLGQAMSFYGQTKLFMAGDGLISNALCSARKNAKYLEIETISLKLAINAYSCFFESPPTSGEHNLNRHISAISSLFKLSPSIVMRNLASSELISNPDIFKKVQDYYPHLKSTLSKALNKIFLIETGLEIKSQAIKKYNLSRTTIQKCLATSADMASSAGTLHILLNLGYLDRLL